MQRKVVVSFEIMGTLVLIAWAILLALNPIYASYGFQSDRINWTTNGMTDLITHFFRGVVFYRKPHSVNGKEGHQIFASRDVRFRISPPLMSAVSSVTKKFISDVCMTNHFDFRPAIYIVGESGCDLPIIGNAKGDLSYDYEWRAGVEPAENPDEQHIMMGTTQSFLPISNQIRIQLLFDLISPGFRKPNRHKFVCSFLGEAVELIPGNCVSIPPDAPISGGQISNSRSREYQLIAKCGDLTTIIKFPIGDISPAVSRDNNFFLRRGENDQSAGFDLGTCSQRNTDHNNRAEQRNHAGRSFHIWVNSGETTVSSFSGAKRLFVIQNARVFVKFPDADRYEIIAHQEF